MRRHKHVRMMHEDASHNVDASFSDLYVYVVLEMQKRQNGNTVMHTMDKAR